MNESSSSFRVVGQNIYSKMNSLSSALAPTLAEEKVTEKMATQRNCIWRRYQSEAMSKIAISEPNPTLIDDIKIM